MLLLPLKDTCLLTYKQFRVILSGDFSLITKTSRNRLPLFCLACAGLVVRLFATPWTVAHQVSLAMGFPREEHWSGSPFCPPGDLPDAGTEPAAPEAPAAAAPAGGFFTPEPLGKPYSLSEMY